MSQYVLGHSNFLVLVIDLIFNLLYHLSGLFQKEERYITSAAKPDLQLCATISSDKLECGFKEKKSRNCLQGNSLATKLSHKYL